MRKNIPNVYSRGVSIIEALLAAVIVGIGFISVYTMATTSTRMIYSSTQRDNDTLSASMIMDDMALDRFAVGDTAYHEAISSAQYNNLDLTAGCTAAAPATVTAASRKLAKQKARWCNFLTLEKGGMKEAQTGDARNIRVTDITVNSNGYSQSYKVVIVNITHGSRGRNQTKQYVKILHE